MNRDTNQGGKQIANEEIAARAYTIYEREGRVEGKDFDHWVRAEQELMQERAGAANGGSGGGSPRAALNGNSGGAASNNRIDESRLDQGNQKGKNNGKKSESRPAAVAERN